MNQMATIGDNSPPTHLEEIMEKHGLLEVENWLDGEPIETDEQMRVVDQLIKAVKGAEKDAKDRKESEFRPHKAAADAVVADWKPCLEELTRQRTGLLALVNDLKVRRAAEQEAIRRKQEAEAERLRREAEHVQASVDMTNLDERREADAISLEARQASKAAADVETVKGLRTFTVVEVTDYSAMLRWMNKNRRSDLEAFCDEYARRHQGQDIPGVEVRKEKRAV